MAVKHSMDDYKDFLAEVRKATGIETLKPDESGLVSVRVDDAYNVNFQFVEATGRILCFVEVAELQPGAPSEVYRDLLAGGLFGKDTAGGYFALEPETETVVYNYFFDLETAAKDVEDFVALGGENQGKVFGRGRRVPRGRPPSVLFPHQSVTLPPVSV